MKTVQKGIVTIVLLVLLITCMAVPAALAAPADNVWVSGVNLTADLPYWKNGSASASATEPPGGWNAYFNASTGTLTLKDAVVNQTVPFLTSNSLICAPGDLSLVLRGTSTITWNSDTHQYVDGIFTSGALAISGDGSLNIQMHNTGEAGSVFGIKTFSNLTVVSGSIKSTLQAAVDAHGMYAFGGAILIAGGHTEIDTKAAGSVAVGAIYFEFRMTGGSLTVNVEGTSEDPELNTHGLVCTSSSLEGGTASFIVSGSATYQSGMYYQSNTLTYSGGTFTFAGGTSALINNGEHTYIQYNLSDDALVYASEYTDGRAPILWKSDADGILTSIMITGNMSDYHYVRFTQPQPVVQAPQTGDESNPWLWVGIAAAAVLLVVGAVLIVRRKRS